MELKVGSKAPDFEGVDENNNKISLKDFLGKKVVLYFYPKDDTPGCTTEACDFRDNFEKITDNGAVVIGVSKDGANSHKKFKKKHELPFILIADEDKKICNSYNVINEKKMFGKTALGVVRTTFLIDEKGYIQKIWNKVKVKGHVEEIIQSLNEQ